MSGIKEIFTRLSEIPHGLSEQPSETAVKKNSQTSDFTLDTDALKFITAKFNQPVKPSDNKFFRTVSFLGESSGVQDYSETRKYITNEADKLIERGTVPDKKINPNKLLAAFVQSSVKNPKAVAAAMYHSSIPNETRYIFAREVIKKLSDTQLKQLSKSDEGRTFLRTMSEIIEDDAPSELKNSSVARQKDAELIGRVRDKMYISEDKQLSNTKGYSRQELKNAAQTDKTAASLINQGSVKTTKLDSEKLTNVLIKEVEKHPFLVDIAML